MSVNQVAITGNLTRDPETRQTSSGMTVMRLGVAVNERRKNPQTGAWEDRPNFVNCTMFGKRADSLAQYLHKGTKVAIAGRLHWSSWQAQDGTKRSALDVIVNDIDIMSTRGQQQQPQQMQGAQATQMADADPYGSEIPF